MSYASARPGNPGTSYGIYNQAGGQLSGYSSSSDIEGTGNNLTDYSDHEGGYSSAASNSYDFGGAGGGGGYRPSTRMGAAPAYTQRRYDASSQSPPPHLYPGIPGAASSASMQQQQQQASGSSSHGGGGGGSGGGGGGLGATVQQQYQRIARFVGPPPVALACTECRSRHLKCDAGTPACTRCLADKRECNYVKSRRGWKGTRRKKVLQQATTATAKPGAGAAAAAAGTGAVETEDDTIGDATTTMISVSGTDTEGPDGGYSSGESETLFLLFLPSVSSALVTICLSSPFSFPCGFTRLVASRPFASALAPFSLAFSSALVPRTEEHARSRPIAIAVVETPMRPFVPSFLSSAHSGPFKRSPPPRTIRRSGTSFANTSLCFFFFLFSAPFMSCHHRQRRS